MSSRNFNKQILVIDSTRNVGSVYTFHKADDRRYACASCKRLGKSRTVTVVNG